MEDTVEYSVLMSVYYKEKYEWLKIAIDSILNQTLFPKEFVIVKDGILPENLNNLLNEYVAKFPELFKIVELEKNCGLGIALRKGILECSYECVVRMDSDDYAVPERCEKLMNFLKENPEYDCVGSFEAEFEGNIENVIAIHKVPEMDSEIKEFMKRRCAILHPTVAYKKSSIIKAGNYNDIKLYEDYDLFMRMVLEHNTKTYNIQET